MRRTIFFVFTLLNKPVSLPFEERIKPTSLTKSYLEVLVVLLNFPLKTLVLLRVEGFEQGAPRKELIIVLYMK